MAQTFIQDGDVIEITAGAAITSGQLVKTGVLVGVALGSAASGEKVRIQLKGVFRVAKASGAISAGAAVYFVDASSNVNTTASGNTFCGHAIEAAQSGDTTAVVRLAQ